MENVGDRIKQTRLKKGLSQAELARAAAVSQPTVANWETGSHIPRQAALERIAAILQTPAAWLISGGALENGHSAANSAYLSRPIRHVPIYAWPDSDDIFLSSEQPVLKPQPAPDYLTLSIHARQPFALNMPAATPNGSAVDGGLGAQGIYVFDQPQDRLETGAVYLFAGSGQVQIREWSRPAIFAGDLPLHERPIARAVLFIRRL